MSKRRRNSGTQVVRTVAAPRAPAPVIRIAAPRAPTAPKKSHRRRSAGGIAGGITPKTMFGAGLGGAALGFIEKTFPNLPTVPVVGRAGTIAIAAYFLSKRGGMPIMRDVALAGAVIAGYELGKTGKVSGEDYVSGDDISGIAAQV